MPYPCTENDPRVDQPGRIKLPLKSHQLAAIHLMTDMERTCKIQTEECNLYANLGLLSDKVGYGKTLTSLGLIAHNENVKYKDEIRSFSETQTKSDPLCSWEYEEILEDKSPKIARRDPDPYHTPTSQTTLIIVPHGPLSSQWENTIRDHTTLSVVVLKSTKDFTKKPTDCPGAPIKSLDGVNIVLITQTMWRTATWIRDQLWRRVILDEAHTLSITWSQLPKAKFVWLITATPTAMLFNCKAIVQCYRWLPTAGRDAVSVQSTEEFLKMSFELPEPHVITYHCRQDRALNSAIIGFIDPHVVNMLNAQAYGAAIEACGGKVGTDNDVIALITRKLRAKNNILSQRIDAIEGMPDKDAIPTALLNSYHTERRSIEEKIQGITDRLTDLKSKDCAICCDTYEDPVTLGCSHVFCAKCIIQWLKNVMRCPMCKVGVKSSEMTVIKERSEIKQKETVPQGDTKLDVAIRIIQGSDRSIVFSRYYESYNDVVKRLEELHITCKVLRGSTVQQTKIIQDFKDKRLKVLLLTVKDSGSGVDLPWASDVIMYQKVTRSERIQAIGRAQRFGRTTTLRVHELLHDNEM